jgi:ethanolaminephosphotransferase
MIAVFNLSTLSLILVSLTRDSNLPIFVLLWAQYYTLASSDELSPLLMSTLLICCQHVSFFAMGGSNSLATYALIHSTSSPY